jgi:hypothetical protein
VSVTLETPRPGTIVWAYFRGYWREVRVLEIKPPVRVLVLYRMSTGYRRVRSSWTYLDRLSPERPKQTHHVVDMPAPPMPEAPK